VQAAAMEFHVKKSSNDLVFVQVLAELQAKAERESIKRWSRSPTEIPKPEADPLDSIICGWRCLFS
jgi:hypothetical protein